MQSTIWEVLKKSLFFKIILLIFIGLTVWWLNIFGRGLINEPENTYFTLTYPFLSLFGGIAGIVIAEKWGGLKSILGRSICMFSFGLLSQFYGQAMYAYYIYIKGVEVPYPSLGDVGYFGSVLFYIIAIYYLAKVSGLRFSFRSMSGKLQAFFIPAALLIFSYSLFLKNYEFDWSNQLKIFLDFGYPLGQAIYVSIAILALLMARNLLGGMMKKPIWFLIFALVIQYFSDFIFLYQSNYGSWYVGGINDYLYCCSYFLMSGALIYIGSIFYKIQES
jgi:hypothetical protein